MYFRKYNTVENIFDLLNCREYNTIINVRLNSSYLQTKGAYMSPLAIPNKEEES